MDIRVNDILVMKKPHCGENGWLVLLHRRETSALRCLAAATS